MQRLFLLVLTASFSLPAIAGLDDAQLDLAITPFSFDVFEGGTRTYDSIQLDIEQSPRVFKANGALIYSVDGDGFPVAGTCAITGESVVFCAINTFFATLYLDLDDQLNGTYLLNDAGGTFISEGEVTFISLE